MSPLSASSAKVRDQITLCIIAGNVEQYIERFLTAFAPLVGRVVMVSAWGSQKPDDTRLIAYAVCAKLELPCELPVYRNAPPALDWPHVDDFAAARQWSFDHATTPWIAWADTDDLIDEASIARIHEALMKHGDSLDALSFEYEVPEDGLTVLKDRILRRGSGHWRHCVHEEYVFTQPKALDLPSPVSAPRIARVPGARITHAPLGPRTANDERNVRLLESMERNESMERGLQSAADPASDPSAGMPTGHRFHYVNSLRAVGRIEDSLAQLTRLLQDPALGPPERYELFMSASQMMAADAARCGQMLLQAFATDPSRREALGELCLYALRTGRLPQALHWSRLMRAIPKPAEYLWNARAKYYGWLGVQLHAWALRANGDPAGAAAHEFNHFTAHGARISLLHATRGRPRQAHLCKQRWYDSAADPDAIEHLFALDSDDLESIPLMMQCHVLVEAGGGCVRAWNAAAALSHGQILIQLSDDWVPPHHWDRLIIDRLGDLTRPSVLAISDGHRTDDLLCMAILTRARYLQQGHLFHPDFLSVYSDNWFTHCAQRDGVLIDATDLVFEHQHPIWTGAPTDATYAQSNTEARYAHGQQVFQALLSMERGLQSAS